MGDITYLNDYVYVGLSGIRYAPEFRNGAWYIGNSETTLLNLAVLLRIEDEEELVMLRLTYGG